jgi:hypothetical protein
MVSSTGVVFVYALSYPVAVLSRGNLLLFIIIIISQYLDLVPDQQPCYTTTGAPPFITTSQEGTMITRQTLPLRACPQQPSCIRAEAPSLRTDGGHLQPLPRIVDLEERCA